MGNRPQKSQSKEKSNKRAAKRSAGGGNPSASSPVPASGLSTWLRPMASFLLASLIVWSFLAPHDAISVFQGRAMAQNLFWLIAACCAASAAAYGGGIRVGRIAWTALLLGLAWVLMATILAGHENSPRRGWNGFWQVMALASCYLAARGSICGSQTRGVLTGLCLAGCVAASVQGIYQIQVEIPAARARYLEAPERELSAAGIYAPPGSPQRIRFEDRLLNSNEPYASFALANSLATLLSGGISLSFMILAGYSIPRLNRRDNEVDGSWIGTASLVVCLTLLTLCWFLTRSRAGYLSVLIALGLGLLLLWYASQHRSSNRKTWVLGGGSSLLLVLIGSVWLIRNDQLVLSEAKKSLGFRLEYWQATLKMISDHWLTGVGLGNFQAYYPFYKLATASEEVADPHNWLLDVAATFGVLIAGGALLWLSRTLYRPIQAAIRSGLDVQAVSSNSSGQRSDGAAEPRADLDRQLARALMLGAFLGGFCCALLLWLLEGANLTVIVVSWLAASLLVFGTWPVLQRALDVQPFSTSMAAVAMLIALLASGSWQASGIAVPLLVWLAVAHPAPRLHPTSEPAPNETATQAAYGATLLAITGLLVFVFQSWLPSINSWNHQQQAQQAPTLQQQISLAQSAAAADQLDADAKGYLAQVLVRAAESASRDEFPLAARRAVEQLDDWLQADRNRFTNWRTAGDLSLNLCAAAEKRSLDFSSWLGRATDYYGESVRRYPTSVELRVQLAAAAALEKDWETAEREIQVAIQLSEGSPHEDKRLGRHRTQARGAEDQMVWLPISGIPPEMRAPADKMVLAEPLIAWIRNQADED